MELTEHGDRKIALLNQPGSRSHLVADTETLNRCYN
jgi:hypothetical protein